MEPKCKYCGENNLSMLDIRIWDKVSKIEQDDKILFTDSNNKLKITIIHCTTCGETTSKLEEYIN